MLATRLFIARTAGFAVIVVGGAVVPVGVETVVAAVCLHAAASHKNPSL